MDTEKNNRLFESSDESVAEEEEPSVFNVTNSYAKQYNDWRRKEELQKLKDKYGDNLDIMSEIEDNSGESGESEGDEDEEEDEESDSGESLSDDPFDDQFFKVFSALKNKAPEIYDKSFAVADDDDDGEEKDATGSSYKSHQKEDKSKRFTLQDYHQKLIKEKKGITEEDEQMLKEGSDGDDEQEKPSGYYEELYNIRREIKNIVNNQGKEDANDDVDDQLFSVKGIQKPTTANESNKAHSHEKDQFVSQIWSKSKQFDKGDEFLKDYIVNKRYLNPEPSSSIKRFKEIESHFGGFENDESGSDASENNDDVQEEGEEEDNEPEDVHVAKYHYEEPDANVIKRYPRAIESIRDTINKDKKTHRAELREKKKQEKQTELKRLRKLKREEIESKIAKLKEISGNQCFDIKDLDLNVIIDDENEFDMEKYDQKMKLLFGDSYYNIGADDGGKPSFEYIPEIDDDLYGDQAADAVNVAKPNKKKSKKDIKRKKDIMADDDIGIYEDIIGGEVATRFRYRMVEPNDFGLTDEEILYADDKELNKWCSLKKMSQYRSSVDETRDKRSYAQKKDNLALKKKIFQSIYAKDGSQTAKVAGNKEAKKEKEEDEGEETKSNEDEPDEVNGDGDDGAEGETETNDQTNSQSAQKKKKRGKKRRKKCTESQPANQSSGEVGKTNEKPSSPPKNLVVSKAAASKDVKVFRKRKRNSKPNGKANGSKMEAPTDVTVQRLKAYGMSNREIKRMKVHKK